MAHNWDLTTI